MCSQRQPCDGECMCPLVVLRVVCLHEHESRTYCEAAGRVGARPLLLERPGSELGHHGCVYVRGVLGGWCWVMAQRLDVLGWTLRPCILGAVVERDAFT